MNNLLQYIRLMYLVTKEEPLQSFVISSILNIWLDGMVFRFYYNVLLINKILLHSISVILFVYLIISTWFSVCKILKINKQ